jgi:RHS repeat-associated protein
LGRDSVHSGYPKAYVNWIFLDDQFNYDSALSGAVPAANSNNPAGTLNPVAPGGPIVLNRSGYLYIWVSNETSGWDVYYDNLSIQYKQGPLLEENHYYPFGLTMAGVSDKAIKTNYAENKYRYNAGAELQNKEFSDGTGLEMYETTFRGYDPQLGRFGQIDPLADRFHSFSPYQFALNSPTDFNDPTGALTEAEFQAVLDEADQILNNPNFQNGPAQNVPLVSGGQLPSSSGGGNGDGVDPAFMPSNLDGYEPVWKIDPINGPVVVGWQKVLPTATVTPSPNGTDQSSGENGLDMARATLDASIFSLDLTTKGVKGAQKLANAVSKTSYAIQDLEKLALLKGGKFGTLTVKGAGTALGFVGLGLTGVQIWEDGGLNISNGTDLVFDGIAFIPGVGWVVSGVYFITNTIVTEETGQSLGTHLSNAINSMSTEDIEASANAMGTCP